MKNSNVIEVAFGAAVEFTPQSGLLRRTHWDRLKRVLLVEPQEDRRAELRDAIRDVAHIDGDADFHTAKAHLLSKPYDWLVTNSRLGVYNGLHLVHLAGAARLPIRFLVYADRHDLWLAQEAQRFGAFYEAGDRVARALIACLRGSLPLQNRRDPAGPDRRAAFRGSRRYADSSFGASFA